MIVVVGQPAWNPGPPPAPAGRAADIALAAAEAGARVELLGRIGDDPGGDALLLALRHAGVGHVALLRDAARPTHCVRSSAPDDDQPLAVALLDGRGPVPEADDEGPRLEPADVALGLRYLMAFDVLVVGDDAPDAVIPVCVEAAAFAGARLVVAIRSAGVVPGGLPEDATLLVAPDEDGEAFPRFLGRYAAALDGGASPEAAFAAAAGDGWERPGG
jgi:sugar/nucleoside kinase (ribokinase family)